MKADTSTARAADAAFDMTNRLLAELRARGIAYLSGGRDPAVVAAVAADPLSPAGMLRALAACPEARVRDATVALLLLHPELARAIPDALAASDPETRERLATLALAALYMSHLWRTRLTIALGGPPALPEDVLASLWQQRDLPPPDELHGEWGLRCLEAVEQRRLGVPFTFRGDWQNAVDHLLARSGCIGIGGWHEHAPSVDKPRIEGFLRRLGEAHRAGRIFLVDSSALVYQGLRARTLDVDITIEGDDADALLQVARRLKDELQVNVELASPADFVPLPPGWHGRSLWIGRFDPLDVYCFDFYSIALSKIVRANQRDIDDVVLLVQHGLIETSTLDDVVRDALPQLGIGHYFNVDPAVVTATYAVIHQRIATT